MDDWLSFLIFAGLFYFMMRYGCGAHMIHGHKDAQHKNTDDNLGGNTINHMDPVCGMKVDNHKGYGIMHKGMLYRFCSRACLDKFEKKPDYYLSQQDNHGEES